MYERRCRTCDFAYLRVVDGVVDRDVSLQGDPNGHEDGSSHGDGQPGVQEVGEEIDVDQAGHLEALANGLENGADQVAGVHADQRDQQEVERVSHVLPGEIRRNGKKRE